MKPFVLIRIAAVIAFLFFVGHSLGAPWTPGGDSAASAVVGAMKSATIPTMKPVRSYWDFYYGFGLSISAYLLVMAVLVWQTATLARSGFSRARPFVASLLLCYLAIGAIAIRFFFLLPAAMAGVVVLCLALAFGLGMRESTAD